MERERAALMKISERLEEISKTATKIRSLLAKCYPHVRFMKLDGDDIISYDNINDIDHDLETVDFLMSDLVDRISWYVRTAEDNEDRKEKEEYDI